MSTPPLTATPFITVVSGLPRSGTSLMMQMLHAGGIPAVTDELRSADEDNPRGYFEFEKVKQLKTDQNWLRDAAGKSIKIIHLLLMDLPASVNGHPLEYRVIMMERELAEVVKSQATMLQRSGKSGGGLPPERLMQVYASQLATVKQWLAARQNFSVLDVRYADLIRSPREQAARINEFLGGTLDVNAMSTAVDPALYRNRATD